MMRSLVSNKVSWSACAALALLLPACQNDGHFCLFGYTTRPNLRPGIRTVRVKVFENRTYRQGLEFELTNVVITEIEKAGYKVVNGGGPADTELTGTIVAFTKGILNVNNVNEQRDVETTLSVQLAWRDLRSGEFLSKPPRRFGEPVVEVPVPLPPPVLEGPPGTRPPTVLATPVLPGVAPGLANTITITTTAHYVPELGQSLATSAQANILKMAREIVGLMENPW